MILLTVFLSCLTGSKPLLIPDKTPVVGEQAPDFELRALDGIPVKLSVVKEKGPVAIVVFRGYPGKQSEPCQRQIADLLNKASSFADAGATVVMVYPGLSAGLDDRAREFVADKMLPVHFRLVTDPDFVLTHKYGLRWDAPGETAFPATFVVNTKGVVTFARVSATRGGRPRTEEILRALSIK
jgi:peroxiredoxin